MPLSSVLGAQSLVKPGVCTSSTRPASPYDGQVIYETDTNRTLVFNGSTWDIISVGVFTSSTRPSGAYEGQLIYETDTDLVKSWNGSSWITVGPTTVPTPAVSAIAGAYVGTAQTTTSTTYTDLATSGPAVTITTGTTAIVSVTCIASNNVANANAESGVTSMSFAVSGATTLAASDERSAQGPQIHTSHYYTRSGTFYVSGLTAGSNTFTAKYRVAGSLATGTGTFYYRNITVTAI